MNGNTNPPCFVPSRAGHVKYLDDLLEDEDAFVCDLDSQESLMFWEGVIREEEESKMQGVETSENGGGEEKHVVEESHVEDADMYESECLSLSCSKSTSILALPYEGHKQPHASKEEEKEEVQTPIQEAEIKIFLVPIANSPVSTFIIFLVL